MIRLAVFDCDGTLVDGQGAVCTAMEQAFASVGAVPPERRNFTPDRLGVRGAHAG